MPHDPLVILDFETTGLHPERGDRITEIGLVRICLLYTSDAADE